MLTEASVIYGAFGFRRIGQMPLNASGKLNRKELLHMEAFIYDADTIIPPANETEKFICEAFSKILGVTNIGRNSNFFSLGGTSISVISLLSEKGFEKLSASDILKNPTPEELSAIMQTASDTDFRHINTLYESRDSKKSLF